MAPPNPLAESTLRLHEVLRDYVQSHGYAPSITDLATAMGFSSKGTVVWHLDRLQEAGLIRRDPGVSRGIVLLDPTTPDTEDPK